MKHKFSNHEKFIIKFKQYILHNIIIIIIETNIPKLVVDFKQQSKIPLH